MQQMSARRRWPLNNRASRSQHLLNGAAVGVFAFAESKTLALLWSDKQKELAYRIQALCPLTHAQRRVPGTRDNHRSQFGTTADISIALPECTKATAAICNAKRTSSPTHSTHQQRLLLPGRERALAHRKVCSPERVAASGVEDRKPAEDTRSWYDVTLWEGDECT